MIAIDLGSNSLRMIQIDCANKQFTRAYETNVKTAEALHSEGIISPAALERILHAFNEASQIFDFKNEPCVAVTTEAMRRASNADAVLERIEKETGVKFEIIGAHKEAD